MGAYLESGQGRVQFPPDARHVLRQLGSTVIFLSWSPSTLTDPRMDDVAAALETLGTRDPDPTLGARDGGRLRLADRQRLLDHRPGADPIALDLERVSPREVGVRPEPPGGDALVDRERGVGRLDRASIWSRRTTGSPMALGTLARDVAAAGQERRRPARSTTASIRPGRVSTTTASRMPAVRSAFSTSSG